MGNCLQKEPQVIHDVWEAREPAEETKEHEIQEQEELPLIVASPNFRHIIIITTVSIIGAVASNMKEALKAMLGAVVLIDFYFAKRDSM